MVKDIPTDGDGTRREEEAGDGESCITIIAVDFDTYRSSLL